MPNRSKLSASAKNEDANQSQSPVGCLAWAASGIAGFAVLAVLWVLIAKESPRTFTWKDATYWAAVLGMIAGRYLEIVYSASRHGEEPVETPLRLGRYTWILLLVSGLAWGQAQSFQV